MAGLTFVGWQEPVGCGGVAVFPDDIVVADSDGAVLIPQKLLDEVVAEAVEQERMEDWIMGEVRGGAKLPGLYPMDARDPRPLRGLAGRAEPQPLTASAMTPPATITAETTRCFQGRSPNTSDADQRSEDDAQLAHCRDRRHVRDRVRVDDGSVGGDRHQPACEPPAEFAPVEPRRATSAAGRPPPRPTGNSSRNSQPI